MGSVWRFQQLLLLYKDTRSNYESMLHLPKALYSGVLHDGAGGEAEGVSQGVRWRCGRSPLILLGVLSTQPLSTESLNARLSLTGRQTVWEQTLLCISTRFKCVLDWNWAEEKFRNRGEGNERERMGKPPTPLTTPELHPEAQRSGKVGLICHNRSRSKWKEDPNIWPTALSFIAQSLSLFKSFPLRGFGRRRVAVDWL